MKKLSFIVLGLSFVLASCQKESIVIPTTPESAEIVFKVEGDLEFDVKTRAAAVTSLSTFGVIAEDTANTEEEWSIASVTQDGPNYSTAKYWPSTDQKYAFYASNAALTYTASGATVSPVDAETDVVVSYSAYSAANYKKSVALTFDHIFSRVGDVTVVAPDGYSVSVSNISVTAPVAGTYNLKTSTWTETGSASAKVLANGNNDLYVVPGTYTVSVTYTLTKGDYVKEFTKTGNVTLAQGKINNITATPVVSSDEQASEIVFTVSLTPWSSQNHDITLE